MTLRAERVSLNLSYGDFVLLDTLNPNVPALNNWISEPDGLARIAQVARFMAEPRRSGSMAIQLRGDSRGDVSIDNFAESGGLSMLHDDTSLGRWISAIRWGETRPLNKGMAFKSVEMVGIQSGWENPITVLAMVPIFSDVLVEKSDADLFNSYCSAVSTYLQWVIMGQERAVKYHGRTENVTISYESGHPIDWFESSGNRRYEATSRVPANPITKAMAVYAEQDEPGRAKRMTPMGQSRQFVSDVLDSVKPNFREKSNIRLESIGVDERGNGSNWLDMDLRTLVDHITNEQRRYSLFETSTNIASAAGDIYDAWREIIQGTTTDLRQVMDPYLDSLGSLWAAVSGLVGVNMILGAIPPIAGKALRSMWIEGLANEDQGSFDWLKWQPRQ